MSELDDPKLYDHESNTNWIIHVERPHQQPSTEAEGISIAPLTPDQFEPETLVSIYRTMLTSRRLDEKMLTLLKQGKGFFHIGASGHEAIQAAAGFFLKPGHDWYATYYRDLCSALMAGATTQEVLLAHLAKADDPNSGGRQMAEHFSCPDKHLLPGSSSVAAQFLPGLGAGMAIMRQQTDAVVYVSGGDGATSQGDFHEMLNWATIMQAPLLCVIQNNRYAISVPVQDQTAGGSAYKLGAGYEGLSRIHVDGTDFFSSAAATRAAIDHIRAGKGPVLLVADVIRLLPHSSSDNQAKYRNAEELEADRLRDPLIQMEKRLLEAGLLNESQVKALRSEVHHHIDEVAHWAQQQADPDPSTSLQNVCFDGDLDLAFESATPAGPPVVLVDAINHALHEEMERDDKVLVYGEDVAGDKGGVFTATRNLTDTFGPDRCFNSTLAEATIIGTAVGLSAAGFKPVVEIQFADYIWPAMQQIRNQMSSFRYRSNNRWDCAMVIRVPCGGYIHGGLCHSQNIEAFFAHMPGILVAMPSNAADAKGMLKAAIRMQDPVLFLEHKALYRAASAQSPEPDSDYLVPFGKAHVVQQGSDVTIVTYGMMVHKSMAVARTLAQEGISVEVIDLRSLIPLDMDTVLDSVRKTNRVAVIHEDYTFAGMGAEISAQIADRAFAYLDAPVKRVGSKFAPIAFAEPLEQAILPQDNDILDTLRNLLAF